MASARLKANFPEFQDKLTIHWRAYPLDVINGQPLPRDIVDQEWPHVANEEPLAECRPWNNRGYPDSSYLAFEAYECAFAQDPVKAFDFDYRIRRAFFFESRWIHLRNTLLEIAEEAGLEMKRFTEDFDNGRYKARVMIDCREALRMRDEDGRPMTSPTLVLPDGEFYHNPFATEKTFNEYKVMIVLKPPEKTGEAAIEGYRDILRRALA
ncbi:MAG: DsbA family protein [Nitrospinota bacterium]